MLTYNPPFTTFPPPGRRHTCSLSFQKKCRGSGIMNCIASRISESMTVNFLNASLKLLTIRSFLIKSHRSPTVSLHRISLPKFFSLLFNIGLDALNELVSRFRSSLSSYSPTEFRACLDEFRDVLMCHLDEEV